MKTFDVRREGGYSTAELLIGAVLMLGVAFALAVGVVRWREQAGLGSVFLHPGTEEAAQRLLYDNFADVSKIGKPAIAGARMVTMTATIAGKDCKVHLYSAPDKVENVYGFTVKRLDCGPSGI